MGSKWQEARWGDIATIEYGKGLRGYQEATGTYRVFGTNGPIGWHDEPLCPFPSVIIGRKGAYRGIHFSPAPFFVIDTAFYLKPKEDFDVKWAYYELLTHDINSMDSGSAIPSTSRESFYRLPVLIPTLPEQRAIAHILGSLDDKIELNHRMNKALEATARAIFKSWFVDFDPVRAKAEGRPTGLPDEIAALFPDCFEDSELGEIPTGWGVRTLKYFALLKTEIIQPSAFPDKIWEHYSIPAYDGGRQPVFEPGKDIKSGKYSVPRNSVLASKLNPQFPRVWLPNVQDADSAICSTEFMPFVPKIESRRSFLYGMLISQPIQSEISSRVTGSTGSRQRVKPKEVAVLPCLVPARDLVDAFCSQVSSLHDNQVSNIRQSEALASIRDTLLPKLISGELRVPDAKKFIEEAD